MVYDYSDADYGFGDPLEARSGGFWRPDMLLSEQVFLSGKDGSRDIWASHAVWGQSPVTVNLLVRQGIWAGSSNLVQACCLVLR